jgi:hypothetical protein
MKLVYFSFQNQTLNCGRSSDIEENFGLPFYLEKSVESIDHILYPY